jgi:hypothetical protein
MRYYYPDRGEAARDARLLEHHRHCMMSARDVALAAAEPAYRGSTAGDCEVAIVDHRGVETRWSVKTRVIIDRRAARSDR